MSNISTPFIYNHLSNYSSIKNILLVDDKVRSYNEFVHNCNDITFPIVYNYNSSSTELITFLTNNFTSFNRLCLVFDGASIADNKLFIDNKPFFTNNDLTETKLENMSDNFQFIIKLYTQFNIGNIDFLACNSLKYKKWTDYFKLITFYTRTKTNNIGIIVGASDNKTGNIKYNTDWNMESTGQDIKPIYFTENISTYAFTLGNGDIITTGIAYIRMGAEKIEYQINSTTGTWYPISTPCNVQNLSETNSLTIKLYTDIVIPNNMNYFVCTSNNILFEGNNKIVTIDNIDNWQGLIKNNGGDGLFSNIIIQNFNLTGTNSYLLYDIDSEKGAGWLCQSNFSYTASTDTNYVPTCKIINCTSTLDIYFSQNNGFSGGGGLVGDNSSVWAIDCSTSGNIGNIAQINEKQGGIFGKRCNQCIAQNCFTTGNINSNGSGGIFSTDTFRSKITNCYTTGTIGADGSEACGGIMGHDNTYCTIKNCYSRGDINSNNGGGIVGQTTTSSTIENCYSTGTIQGASAGGICGNIPNMQGDNPTTIQYCYTTGLITGNVDNLGGIIGGTSTIPTLCFSENSGRWSNFNASYIINETYGLALTPSYDSNLLLVDPFGIVWYDTNGTIENPWSLISFYKNEDGYGNTGPTGPIGPTGPTGYIENVELGTNGYVILKNVEDDYIFSNKLGIFENGIIAQSDFFPDSNNLYSLGSITNQWKDLYVGSNSIYVDGVPITSVGNSIYIQNLIVGNLKANNLNQSNNDLQVSWNKTVISGNCVENPTIIGKKSYTNKNMKVKFIDLTSNNLNKSSFTLVNLESNNKSKIYLIMNTSNQFTINVFITKNNYCKIKPSRCKWFIWNHKLNKWFVN